MHSSRMRTAHVLTVWGGGGGWCIPEEILGKKIEKKEKEKKKKFGDPPKIGDPPKNCRHPPEKLETPRKIGDPPVNRITHACENITLPELRCGRYQVQSSWLSIHMPLGRRVESE